MKKFVILLLVFSLLTLTSCELLNKNNQEEPPVKEENNDVVEETPDTGDDGSAKICEIANKSKSTKITTEVSYKTNTGDKLTGYYVTATDGENMIFNYYYERFATPAESLESGNSDRIVSFEGVLNYKDGVYFGGDDEDWKPGSGTAYDLKFNFDPALLQDVVVNEDGNILEAKVSAENLALVIGTSLNAVGNADISLTTNGVNLTAVVVSCTTANGTVTVRSSFTYNQQDLFPEVEEDNTVTEETENT